MGFAVKNYTDRPMDEAQAALFKEVLALVHKEYRRGDDLGALMEAYAADNGCYVDCAKGRGLVCYTIEKPNVNGSVVVSSIGSKRVMISAHDNDKRDVFVENHFVVPVRK